MMGLPSGTPIYLCTEPVDFRNGFDGLTGIVTTTLGRNVIDGSLFLFVNRRRDRIKALWWETGGLTLIIRIRFGLRSDVAKKEIKQLGFEKWGEKGVGKGHRLLCHHPIFY